MTTSVFPGAYDDFTLTVPAGKTEASAFPGATTPTLSVRLKKLEDEAYASQHHAGKTGETDTSSVEWRLRAAYSHGMIVAMGESGMSPSNTSSQNTTALQNAINFIAFMGGHATFEIPAGDYDLGQITVQHDNFEIKGHGQYDTVLHFVSTDAGPFFLVGSGSGSTTKLGITIRDLELHNDSTVTNGESVGIEGYGRTHFKMHNVAFAGFRKHAFYGHNFADSDWYACTFDFCGSGNDDDLAVIQFDSVSATTQAANSVRMWGCRFENNGDRLFEFVSAGSLVVNEIKAIACKFESSVLDGNGQGGSAVDGTPFHLYHVDGVSFIDCSFILQGLRTSHAIIPRMFHQIGGTAKWLGGSIVIGAIGTGHKPFTSFWELDTVGLTQIDNVKLTNPAATGCMPTQVIQRTGTCLNITVGSLAWSGIETGTLPTWKTGSAPANASVYT